MNQRLALSTTALVVLAAGVLVNPPPGELVGIELTTAAWMGLVLLAIAGATVTVIRPHDPRSLAGAAAMTLPLLGPPAPFGSQAFVATAAAAVAVVLHVERMTFAARFARWRRDRAEDQEALSTYLAAYRRAYLKLATVLAAGLGLVLAAFEGLRRIAPTTFEISLEARHPEGLAAFTLLLATLTLGAWLLTHTQHQDTTTPHGDGPDEAPTPAGTPETDAAPPEQEAPA